MCMHSVLIITFAILSFIAKLVHSINRPINSSSKEGKGREGGMECKVPMHLIEKIKTFPCCKCCKTEVVDCNHTVYMCTIHMYTPVKL